MAAPLTSSPRDEKIKKLPKNEKDSNKKVLVLAQELKLARVLAGNNKVARDRALKHLKRWFKYRSNTTPFTEDDFMRIWKGLFYSMWMSDKPLIQEECAEYISHLVHDLELVNFYNFFKCGIQTLLNEWFGIDQLRLDKFLMFVRRFLRQGLFVLKNNNWNKGDVKKFMLTLSETILHPYKTKPIGLLMHIIEIFLEELAKVSDGDLREHILLEILKPFVEYLAVCNDGRLLDHLKRFIFAYLIQQSDLGLEYREKFKIWQQMGFPGSINQLKKVQNDDDEKNSEDEEIDDDTTYNREKIFDPRAGRVDVILPQLKFNPKLIKELLLKYKFIEGSNPKSRKILNQLVDNFSKLSKGVYPYGMKKLNLPKTADTKVKKATNRLIKFNQKIMADAINRKELKKKKKKKNKIALNLENGDTEENQKDLKMTNVSQEVQVIKKKKKKVKNEEMKAPKKEKKMKKEKIITKVEKPKKRKIIDDGYDTPIKKKIKKNLNETIKRDPIESIFKRNSGIWIVTQKPDLQKPLINEENKNLGNFLDEQLDHLEVINENVQTNTETSPKSMNKSGKHLKKSPKKDKSPKTKLEENGIFPKSEWDEPLNEGEYEIVIPYKKSPPKTQILQDTIETLKTVKTRYSFDVGLLGKSTPTKKVKFNTKLNKSQEFIEHHKKILSSPELPYDANKRPSKPLLKNNNSTPINPFEFK